MPHGSPPELSAPLPFGFDSPLNWDAPPARVESVFQSFDPSFDCDTGDASGEEVFSPGWDQMGQEAEDILTKYLGSTYKTGLAPREATTASTENTLGPLFSSSGKRNLSRGIILPNIFQGRVDEMAKESPSATRASGHD